MTQVRSCVQVVTMVQTQGSIAVIVEPIDIEPVQIVRIAV